jgi:hypothetical protein
VDLVVVHIVILVVVCPIHVLEDVVDGDLPLLYLVVVLLLLLLSLLLLLLPLLVLIILTGLRVLINKDKMYNSLHHNPTKLDFFLKKGQCHDNSYLRFLFH